MNQTLNQPAQPQPTSLLREEFGLDPSHRLLGRTLGAEVMREIGAELSQKLRELCTPASVQALHNELNSSDAEELSAQIGMKVVSSRIEAATGSRPSQSDLQQLFGGTLVASQETLEAVCGALNCDPQAVVEGAQVKVAAR